MDNLQDDSSFSRKLGNMEDFDHQGQLDRANLLSKTFVQVLQETGEPLLVSEASKLVAKRLGMSTSQTSYGVLHGLTTGAFVLNQNTFQLSLPQD